ncbi:riboflavin kinase [Pseudarthrobacter sp. S9]|uniref:riboflavin kinase n=1 Tax=Pseudarthrobacter sp. S9 TaxID=3418421 RepID=UPI003D0393CF
MAAVSIGRRRTLYPQEGNKLIEAHLLDFNEDLYGRKLSVVLTVKLRDQQTFARVHALTEQLRHDVTATRNWAKHHFPRLVPPGPHQRESGTRTWPEQPPRRAAAAQ